MQRKSTWIPERTFVRLSSWIAGIIWLPLAMLGGEREALPPPQLVPTAVATASASAVPELDMVVVATSAWFRGAQAATHGQVFDILENDILPAVVPRDRPPLHVLMGSPSWSRD